MRVDGGPKLVRKRARRSSKRCGSSFASSSTVARAEAPSVAARPRRAAQDERVRPVVVEREQPRAQRGAIVSGRQAGDDRARDHELEEVTGRERHERISVPVDAGRDDANRLAARRTAARVRRRWTPVPRGRVGRGPRGRAFLLPRRRRARSPGARVRPREGRLDGRSGLARRAAGVSSPAARPSGSATTARWPVAARPRPIPRNAGCRRPASSRRGRRQRSATARAPRPAGRRSRALPRATSPPPGTPAGNRASDRSRAPGRRRRRRFPTGTRTCARPSASQADARLRGGAGVRHRPRLLEAGRAVASTARTTITSQIGRTPGRSADGMSCSVQPRLTTCSCQRSCVRLTRAVREHQPEIAGEDDA